MSRDSYRFLLNLMLTGEAPGGQWGRGVNRRRMEQGLWMYADVTSAWQVVEELVVME